MQLIDKLAKYREKTTPIFTGTTDIVVVQREDNSMYSSYFNLRVGKLKHFHPLIEQFPSDIIHYDEEVPSTYNTNFTTVQLIINKNKSDVTMKLNLYNGVAYFIQEQNRELKELNNIKEPLIKSIVLNLSRIPTPEQLQQLNLNIGENLLEYEIVCQKFGKQVISSRIFKILASTRIFISDIDGTITKSDFMGNVMQSIGKNYTHDDICELYQNINSRGYLIVYVSSRSQVQYEATRNYIERQLQNGHKLPPGPLLLSDDSIYEAFKVEVIYHTTDQLKKSILDSVKDPRDNAHQLYAGIGNRFNDVNAYKSVGIPLQRIFLIDKKSNIQRFDDFRQLTYRSMQDNIDEYFPNYIEQ